MKDITDLDEKLSSVIKQLSWVSLSSNAASDAPIDKRDLDKLRRETVKALTSFKAILIDYLSE